MRSHEIFWEIEISDEKRGLCDVEDLECARFLGIWNDRASACFCHQSFGPGRVHIEQKDAFAKCRNAEWKWISTDFPMILNLLCFVRDWTDVAEFVDVVL